MAEYIWDTWLEGWSDYFLGNVKIGYIHRYPDSALYRAFVLPLENGWSKPVADNVSEAEAKKAVEDYWADKTAAEIKEINR